MSVHCSDDTWYYTYIRMAYTSQVRKRIEKTDEQDQRALHNAYIYIICMYSHIVYRTQVPIYSTRGQVFALQDRIIDAARI